VQEARNPEEVDAAVTGSKGTLIGGGQLHLRLRRGQDASGGACRS